MKVAGKEAKIEEEVVVGESKSINDMRKPRSKEMKQIEKQVIRNNDIDEWKKSDFKNISFIIKSNKNDSIFYLKNYISEKKTTYFYSFSEPFFLKNREKIAIF